MFSKLIISLVISVSFLSVRAQVYNIYEPEENVVLDGIKCQEYNNPEIVVKNTIDRINAVHNNYFTYYFHNITNRKTGYDLQSNASPQQVWYDLERDYIHSVFMNSQVAVNPWADRTSLYFGSTDMGSTWFEMGGVPINNGSTGRSGYPAIYGLSTGEAVISNHNNSDGTTAHTKIFIDNSPFEYSFTTYDPGDVSVGILNWPRLTVNLNDDVAFVSSTWNTPPDYPYVNLLDLPGGTFLGYNEYPGTIAEQYALAMSNSGKVGMAFNGSADENNDGDVFYWESTDGGISWSAPLKIFDRPDFIDTAMGAIRGVSCNFFGENPCVVFEICHQNFSTGNFFPGLPNEIHFWSPNVNGGVSFAIADSNNVPYYPYQGTNDVHVPFCRPVIGRSEIGNFLFVAFTATTENIWPDPPDPTTYCAGYFMYTSDGGNTWSTPEKFTPQNPLLDWRHISIAPSNPVVSGLCTVHMVIQGDSIPGSTVMSAGMPVGITAQYYHVSTEPIIIPVELISFTAELDENKVLLRWQTSTETNNQGFEIQRKINHSNRDSDWEVLAFIDGHGTTTEPQIYSYYNDISTLNSSYLTYRLKQIDYDGSFEYSKEVTVENSMTPRSYSLSQNYPNPFNPTTIISYGIPVKSNVIIKVFNSLGQEVKTLVNEEKEAGTHIVEFNASDIPSGVFVYQLKAGDFVETKKMVLVK